MASYDYVSAVIHNVYSPQSQNRIITNFNFKRKEKSISVKMVGVKVGRARVVLQLSIHYVNNTSDIIVSFNIVPAISLYLFQPLSQY